MNMLLGHSRLTSKHRNRGEETKGEREEERINETTTVFLTALFSPTPLACLSFSGESWSVV